MQSPEGTVTPSAGTSFTANLKDTYQASLLNRLYPSFVSFPLPDFTSISIVAVSKVHVGLTSKFTQPALPDFTSISVVAVSKVHFSLPSYPT